MELPQQFGAVFRYCVNHVPIDRFSRLCQAACLALSAADSSGLHQADSPSAPSDPAEKEAVAVLCGLLAEAGSRGVNLKVLLASAEDRGLTGAHLAALGESVSQAWPSLQRRRLIDSSMQLSAGHIVDTQWRFDYQIGSTRPDDQVRYQIGLVTTAEPSDKQPSQVLFSCTKHQLMDLLGQTREALRAVELAAAAASGLADSAR